MSLAFLAFSCVGVSFTEVVLSTEKSASLNALKLKSSQWYLRKKSEVISGESLPLLLLLFKMLPQLHLRSEPFSLRVKEVDVKSARGLSLLPLDNLQTKVLKKAHI